MEGVHLTCHAIATDASFEQSIFSGPHPLANRADKIWITEISRPHPAEL
ncbi:hypothetical protein HMPREF3038_02034 [Akkermansia sp. KLE1797]|nr:hypothetical protein HMPREF3038_02034 [Akkermansia sp. KLE1797]KXU53632.1 hypothetical protein HMPREF3039_02355 [Akkermansia sp. KLE1798]KZA05668.1 hypothetical protein HMPREF1326_00656 [Akkermansia sp. KLE1605]